MFNLDGVMMFIAGAAFTAALALTMDHFFPAKKECPAVAGQKVIVSSHDSSGHYCTYARADGMAKRKIKL
jgi:hypothetical protein